ncbi:hypothetical protein TI39_contig4159g00038 [Zymoseptoria brevis]|uniref:Uncharacterized protein n=1 Tax=Zymoseptoria brevis TaxID=1047168 RepID=A0A0F4GCM2_9PEZI|nr:hypothetical protein TI39_contig4159g00038 [Zymoseptoria brevis]
MAPPSQANDNQFITAAAIMTVEQQFKDTEAQLTGIQKGIIDCIREPNELSQALQRQMHKTIGSLKLAKDDYNSVGRLAGMEKGSRLSELDKQVQRSAESIRILGEEVALLGTIVEDFEVAVGVGHW